MVDAPTARNDAGVPVYSGAESFTILHKTGQLNRRERFYTATVSDLAPGNSETQQLLNPGNTS